MGSIVRLLGRPVIEGDASQQVLAPRGRKAWALLAYLLLAERPPSRQRLVSLLFFDADDPLRALRWNLSELRRALAGAATISGDPVLLRLHPDHRADVHILLSGDGCDDEQLTRLGGELLEGVDPDASPAFEAWLATERQRLAASCHALLYEAALDALAHGRNQQAALLAARVVELAPLDADGQAVLVRSLATVGDTSGARLQAARCMDLFRRELGVDAPSSVARAAEVAVHAAPAQPVAASSATARSYVDAGRASLAAGAVGAALEQLRRAAEIADRAGDDPLRATALVALAGGTIHGAGGRGAEVAEWLHQGLALAEVADDGPTAAASCRELAFLGVQLGHYERADAWLDRAEQYDIDDNEYARVLGVRGMSRSDSANYSGALEALARSIEHAERVGTHRQAAWSRSMIGRIHVLHGEPTQAARLLDHALNTLHETRWTAFLPWAESFRAEAALDSGALDAAADLLEHAWVLATEARDHCWMATVARGLARLAAARGNSEEAIRWVARGLQPTPWYMWPYANLLDAGCDIAMLSVPERARSWMDELGKLAARCGMREHVIRAQLHGARLGAPHALDAARHAGASIDNPALHHLLERTGTSP